MATIVLAQPAAHACGYDGLMGDFSAAHPGSISVALALKEAFDRNDLKALTAMPPAFALLRANRMAKDFSPYVKRMAAAADGSVAVLLVESGLWTRFAISKKGVTVEPHIVGPKEGDAVILTSEAVLRAILDQKLTPDRAAELGLIKFTEPDRA